jgi:hypothetical protein
MKTLFAAVLLAVVVVLVPAASARPVCGYLRGDEGERYRIAVEKGTSSCRTARRVFVDLFAGRGTPHPGPKPSQSYTQVGAWRCFFGMGVWECSRSRGRQDVVASPG